MRFSCTRLRGGGGTGHAAEDAEVGPEGHDVVVPIHEEEAVDETQFDAIPAEEVGAESCEGDELAGLGSSADCGLHGVVDVDLEVEEVTRLRLGLGELVEEVVQQEEVAEEAGER